MALSTYPFWLFDQDNTVSDTEHIPTTWLNEMHDLAPQKPFVVSETGYIAEDLMLLDYKVNVQGTPEWQKTYTQILCQKAEELNTVFICWFIYRDYDLMYEQLTDPPQFFLIWKDNGMRDGNGQARPALSVWREWLNRDLDR